MELSSRDNREPGAPLISQGGEDAIRLAGSIRNYGNLFGAASARRDYRLCVLSASSLALISLQ